MAAHVSVAAKRRQHVLMAEILRPGLVLLRRLALLSTEQRQRLPEAMRVEVGQACRLERLLEDGPDRTSAAPVLTIQSCRLEPEIGADRDLSRREQWIVQPPELGCPQVGDPLDHHRSDVVAHWEKGGD